MSQRVSNALCWAFVFLVCGDSRSFPVSVEAP
jgi:hypothetical protein